MQDTLMNIHEAAAFLGRKHQTLRRMVANGTLPAYKEGKSLIFRQKDLEKIKEERFPEGMTHTDIHNEYDVNRTTVIMQFRRLGVEACGQRGSKVKSSVYSPSTVAKFADLLGWRRRRKNPTDE